ncbi:MAG: tetratricopeptide repeat protein, partial [Oscillospiraceae bacterium]|nr:tetratricopeptide repeat protein [Oscillospiraceae bacterium]
MSGKKHIVIAAMLLIVAVIGMIIAMNRTDSSSSEEKLLQAQEYFDLMDYDKVVAIYNDIISSDGSCTEAYIGLADVYYVRGNLSKTLEILERGLDRAADEEEIRKKMTELFSDKDIEDIN